MNETSLSRLHDIVAPPPVPLWPPAPGWYVVGAAALLLLGFAAWRLARRWRRNAYRRAALADLHSLQDPGGVSPLLKRTALVAWPREQVASLSGDQWHHFLAESVGQARAESGWATSMDRVGYNRDANLSEQERQELLAFAELWIRRHRVSSS